MIVRLVREARIRHSAGEIVNVSPAEASFLLSVGSAVKVTNRPIEAREEDKGVKRKKK